MKAVVKVKKEVEITTLKVKAGVRYWEDAEINGQDDTEDGKYVPCKEADLWCPEIDFDSGLIRNWIKGVNARIHYKVCDAGSYYLIDKDGETVLSIEDNYVPDLLAPDGEGYGDYIILDIDVNGQIANWKPSIKDFVNFEDEQ
jgi:hypothetical protein